MAWSAVTLVIALATLASLAMRRERRKKAALGTRAKPKPTGKTEAAARQVPEAGSQHTSRSCPVCLSDHPAQNRFCFRDGAALVEGASAGSFVHGMICPACRRGYPADASFCPEDAEELVPYGLYGAASSTRSALRIDASKICPECGVRHASSHLFCGQDGTELVIVN
ncbi:MAG: hypothetical protein AMJ62_13035 [Myxococcales bacterium SG8_38]|nr:MAG: hypothetical protein AMJ62_13035 [Myxococcales bacterium SG8_38]